MGVLDFVDGFFARDGHVTHELDLSFCLESTRSTPEKLVSRSQSIYSHSRKRNDKGHFELLAPTYRHNSTIQVHSRLLGEWLQKSAEHLGISRLFVWLYPIPLSLEIIEGQLETHCRSGLVPEDPAPLVALRGVSGRYSLRRAVRINRCHRKVNRRWIILHGEGEGRGSV